MSICFAAQLSPDDGWAIYRGVQRPHRSDRLYGGD